MTVHPFAAMFFLLVVGSAPLAAQAPDSTAPPGRVVGRIVDGTTGDGVPGAGVTVDGTSIGTRTDVTGRFTLLAVPPGAHAVSVRVIGYAVKTVTGVAVLPGSAARLDITIDAAAIQMAAVEVTATIERGSVAQAIAAQRTATQIVSTISSEQIGKSPDSDAGQVMQRVSGATVQDGKYVFVRGLGERYTTASLNNVRLPSPEPDRKVVPLDVFPSGLLQSVVTSKTFTPEQPGDFTGAQVDLRTREFPTEGMLSVSVSSGFNDAVTFRDVIAAPRVGSEWYGFAGSERTIPGVALAAGNLSGLSQQELSAVINSFRNVWSPWTETAKPNGSMGISLGGEDIVAGRPLGYVASLSYSEGQEIRLDEERRTTSSDANGVTAPLDETEGSSGTVSVLWGGLVNVSTHLSPAAKLSINNAYTRSLENQATRHLAYDNEFTEFYEATRLSLVERTMRSNQLRGEHLLSGQHSLMWSLTSSGVRRYEPDRSDLRYQTALNGDGQRHATIWSGEGGSAVRTFNDLTEHSLEGSAALTLAFGVGSQQWRAKVGGLYRDAHRDSDSRAYGMVDAGTLTDAQKAAAPEQIFAGPNADAGAFYLIPDVVLGPYVADDAIAAGFVQVEAPLSDRVRVIGGARVERWALDLALTATGRLYTRRNTDILPALSVNIKLADAHALRLSASQTVARPEYREIAPVGSRSFVGEYDVQGNENLQRALVRNLDARWEWYPSAAEVVSVGLFAKYFDNPIEKVIQGLAGADGLTFVNADGATSHGVELELRSNLRSLAAALAPFQVFANATFMRSHIQPGTTNLTNTNRPMVGQANYVVNAGLGYTAPLGGFAATVLYNIVGPRVAEAGANPRPDAYEQPRHMLDVSAMLPLFGMSLKLDAKNLLDAPVHITQGDVTRLRYRTGRVFSLGASWRP